MGSAGAAGVAAARLPVVLRAAAVVGIVVAGIVGFVVVRIVGGLLRADRDDAVDGDFRRLLVRQLFAFLHAIHVGDAVGLLDFAVLAFLPDHDLTWLQRLVHDGLRAERHGFRTRFRAMGDALHSEHGFAVVLFDADAILLADGDAFGIEDRCRRKLAVRCHGGFAVRDDGDGALLVDDQPAGQLVVHIADVDGHLRGLRFVLLEETKQLFGAGGHRPERHLLSVDGDGGLIGAFHRDDVMVLQHAGRRGGFDQIMGFDLHALFLQQTVDAHRIGRDGGGFAVDGQRHGFAGADAESQSRSECQRSDAYRDTNAPMRYESLWRPPSCHSSSFRCLFRLHTRCATLPL